MYFLLFWRAKFKEAVVNALIVQLILCLISNLSFLSLCVWKCLQQIAFCFVGMLFTIPAICSSLLRMLDPPRAGPISSLILNNFLFKKFNSINSNLYYLFYFHDLKLLHVTMYMILRNLICLKVMSILILYIHVGYTFLSK